jgi:hypothetical protein
MAAISSDLFPRICDFVTLRNAGWRDGSAIGEIRGVGAHALVTVLDTILRKGHLEQDPERLCTTESLLFYLTAFRATNPHDILYANASLSNDSLLGLVPDYSRSIGEVCTDLISQAASR